MVVAEAEVKKISCNYSRWEDYSRAGCKFFEEAILNEIEDYNLIPKIVRQEKIIKKWRQISLSDFYCLVNRRKFKDFSDWIWDVNINIDDMAELEECVRMFFSEKMIKGNFFFKRSKEEINWRMISNAPEQYLVCRLDDKIRFSRRVMMLDIGCQIFDVVDGRRRAYLVGVEMNKKIKKIKRSWCDGSWLTFDLQKKLIKGEVTLAVRQNLKEKYF